jgi:hypothetical protein
MEQAKHNTTPIQFVIEGSVYCAHLAYVAQLMKYTFTVYQPDCCGEISQLENNREALKNFVCYIEDLLY